MTELRVDKPNQVQPKTPQEINPGMQIDEPIIYERSRRGKAGVKVPQFFSGNGSVIPERKTALALPEVSELDVVRHFTRLSQKNFSIDLGMYPLGSCTMKYNPRLNESVAAHKGFSHLHPYMPDEYTQGALSLLYELEQTLTKLTGLSATTLTPAAGAQGEFLGLLLIRAYFEYTKQPQKKTILIPDTAHGTNPASCHFAGFNVKPVRTGANGHLTVTDLKAVMSDDVAGLMMTNPNTLGLFETDVRAISDVLHEHDAFLYGDGANFNAFVGKIKPGDLGIDVIHLNLHKTFSTPHGGGGPGSGPVSVCDKLVPFLPAPRLSKRGDVYHVDDVSPTSVGKVKPFWGQFLVLVRAWTYIKHLGIDGLIENTEHAVLNARYIQEKLKDVLKLAYTAPCMHEAVFSDASFKKTGIKTIDIAKALMDFGFHPPTTYFPLNVSGAIMIEPTECESKADIDRFCDVLRFLVKQAHENPDYFKDRPRKAPMTRVDEVRAAKNLDVTYVT
jgi:glycine dehydrogenase subunit 2